MRRKFSLAACVKLPLKPSFSRQSAHLGYPLGIAVFAAAAICPIVNTGVFALGCFVFFFKDIANLAADMGFNNAVSCIFIGFIGVNFLLELAANIILSPVILRVLNFNKK